MKKQFQTIPCRFEFHDYPGYFIAKFFIFDGTEEWKKEPHWNLPLAKKSQFYPGSFEKAKNAFIQRCQKLYVLDVAGASGRVMVPENYHLEFWTPSFICKLASVLQRPRKRGLCRAYLSAYLKMFWNYPWIRLSEKDRYELADFVNWDLQLTPKITPGAVWQRKKLLGLISKRTRGPKPRKTIC